MKTPSRGVVAKFTSREANQLQVPALLVHCIQEIEQRGLQEVGIYRLNVYADLSAWGVFEAAVLLLAWKDK